MKTHRINGQEVKVKASNAAYNGSINGVDNAQSAIDNLDGRLAEVEQSGGGGSSVVITGDAVPLTNDDPVAYDLQHVFEKTFTSEDLPSNSIDWQFELPENYCLSNEPVTVTQGDTFKVVFEIQASSGTLGSSGLYIHWRNFFGRTKSYSSLSHVYDGVKDIYSCTASVSSQTASRTNAATGGTQFKIPSVTSGTKVKISVYVEYNGTRFFFKKCRFSATASSNDRVELPYALEWDATATTPNKVRALMDNHMIPMCSAGSEYDPFVERITTSRVLVTIVSDDGGAGDYKTLNPFLKGKAADWNETHPNDDPIDIRWSCAVPSNYVQWDETRLGVDDAVGSCMTANMIRDLVANHGVSVLAHGYNHDYISKDNVYLTEAELDLVAKKAKMQLERQVGVPCVHYCLPGGKAATVSSGGYSSDAILSRYFLSAAHIQVKAAGTPLMNNINTPDTDRFQIRRVSFDIGGNDLNAGDTQIAFIEAAQNYVTQNSKSAWVVFYTHAQEWKTGGVAHALTIPAVVDYCIENGIPLVNYSEAYAEIYPPIDRLKTLLGINS